MRVKNDIRSMMRRASRSISSNIDKGRTRLKDVDAASRAEHRRSMRDQRREALLREIAPKLSCPLCKEDRSKAPLRFWVLVPIEALKWLPDKPRRMQSSEGKTAICYACWRNNRLAAFREIVRSFRVVPAAARVLMCCVDCAQTKVRSAMGVIFPPLCRTCAQRRRRAAARRAQEEKIDF